MINMLSFAPHGRREYVIKSKGDLVELEMGLAFYARASLPYGTQSKVMDYILARMIKLSLADQPSCGFRVNLHHISTKSPDDYKVNVERVEMEELAAQAKMV
jgi:hypothetical protein